MQPDTSLPKEPYFKTFIGKIKTKPTGSPLTSGTLTINTYYLIYTLESGDDFTNVVGSSIGTPGSEGSIFKASGTTPTNWSNGSLLYVYSRQLIELHNTIGTLTYTADGTLRGGTITGSELFTEDKTIVLATPTDNVLQPQKIFATVSNTSDIITYLEDFDNYEGWEIYLQIYLKT